MREELEKRSLVREELPEVLAAFADFQSSKAQGLWGRVARLSGLLEGQCTQNVQASKIAQASQRSFTELSSRGVGTRAGAWA